MLNGMMLARNAGGRIRCTTNPASTYGQGCTFVATTTGLWALSLTAPTVYNGAKGFSAATGALCADIGGTPAFGSQGLLFTSAGRVACDQLGAITGSTQGGLPITATGAIAVGAPE
jgi:hypothetical protein